MENSENIYFQEENIDIKKFLMRILGNWYWFAISLFITVTVAYLVNRYSEPVYSVTSTIIVRDDEKGKGLSGAEQMIEGMEMFRSRKNIYNEMGILQSYELTNRTLKDLENFEITYINVGRRGIKESKLYNRSPFVVNIDTSFTQRRAYPINVTLLSNEKYLLEIDEEMDIRREMKYGEQFIHEAFNFNIELRDPESFETREKASNKYYFIINDFNSLTNAYKGKLGITVNDKKGSILILTTQGYVAQQEADFLNKLGEIYILSGLEQKNRTAENTIEFIDSQLQDIAHELWIAENNLQEFRTENQVIDISKEGQMIFEKFEAYQSQKNTLDISLKYYDYLLNYIKGKSNFSDIVAPSIMGVNDPILTATLVKLGQLNTDKTNLEFTVTESSP